MIINKKKEDFIFLILYLILFLILVEGFICRPLIGPSWHIECHLDNPPLLCKHGYCKVGFLKYFWLENGFVEILQIILLIPSIFLLIKAKYLFSEDKIINTFLIIKILALIYYLGEEISWGQHFFNWSSPIWFLEYNNQKETNIHNISNLFDQLPRTLVITWCTLVPITVIIIKYFYKFNNKLLNLLCPDKKLFYLALLTLFFILPDLIVDKFDLHPNNNTGYYYDMFTFNFLKLSELHELLFCYYFLFYSIFFNKLKKN